MKCPVCKGDGFIFEDVVETDDLYSTCWKCDGKLRISFWRWLRYRLECGWGA